VSHDACRLHQLAAKKGLEADWVRGFQERENSNSSGDQGTESAISLSRWVPCQLSAV
jgi:hypothetical protein